MRVIQWFLTIFLVLAGVVTAIATYRVASLPDGDPNYGNWLLMTLISGIATVIFGVVQKLVDLGMIRSRAKELQALRSQFFEVFDGPLGRLIDQVERMAAEPASERAGKIDSIRYSIVQAAVKVVGSEDARATYFRVEDYAAHDRRMKGDIYNYSDNRSDNATSLFVESASTDREVWTVLATGVPAFEADLSKRQPPTWNANANREYKCFATYRVHVSDVGIGLLTINTLTPNDLKKSDLSILAALAKLLSAAETVALSPQGLQKILTDNASRP
jgi:hypothetical protein